MNNTLLRPNAQRANIAISLLYSALAIKVLSLVSEFFQYSLLLAANNGEGITPDAAEANDTRQLAIQVIFIIVYIISGVTFIRWFRRAYYNLGQHVKNLTYSNGWAAGAWFVPFLSLFAPFQIMNELWSHANRLLIQKDNDNDTNITKNKNSNAIVVLWWITWVITQITGVVLSQYSKDCETIDELIKSTEISMFLSVTTIISAAIAAAMVRRYADMEKRLFEIIEVENSNQNMFDNLPEQQTVEDTIQ